MMTMKHLFTLLLLCSLSTTTILAQNYKQEFEKLCEQGDTIKQKKLLEKWEKGRPNDAELYIAYFNFYVSRSKTEIVTKVPHPDADKIPKAKKQAGYTSEIGYRAEPLGRGFKYINAGIAKYPDRLDMRFGKVYMLGETYKYAALTQELVNVLNYSTTIENKWRWTDNKFLEKPEEFMLSAIQEYVATIYNSGKSQADNMKEIAETVLKYYPKHVESLSDLGIVYTMKGDLNMALRYFLKATAIEPKDFIVLNNIANIYNKKKDTTNAVKYYEQALKYGDTEAKELANKELKRLNRKPADKTTTTAAKAKTTAPAKKTAATSTKKTTPKKKS
ncbi:TPR repeat-containing protein [Chitinophaga sancti]|uniref:TPR repeat-containing protein n=2 Tax=Chitinophaga sancti TaxID=1004 RepID=A0A1K1PFR7_9BACT|nr:TPR repeat-containing protein [Chitinophaga sancti]